MVIKVKLKVHDLVNDEGSLEDKESLSAHNMDFRADKKSKSSTRCLHFLELTSQAPSSLILLFLIPIINSAIIRV